jgi:hypothetical protein
VPVSALGAQPYSYKTWSDIMLFNGKCWRPLPSALVTVMICLSGCGMVGFDTLLSACPPLVEYSPDEQCQVADEIAALPEGGVIVEWLMDYAVLRAQVRACM